MKVNKETINLNIFHSELQKDELVLFGDRGGDKRYEIRIKLDEDWKATVIAEKCKLRLVKKIQETRKYLQSIHDYLSAYTE